MKEVKQYVAFDGEVFDSEDECLKYEFTFKRIPSSVRFFDSDKNEIPFSVDVHSCSLDDIDKEMEDIYNKAFFMFLENTPSLQEDIDTMYGRWGFPDEFRYASDDDRSYRFYNLAEGVAPGLYEYSNETWCEWVKVDLKREEEDLEAAKQRILGIKEMLKGANL